MKIFVYCILLAAMLGGSSAPALSSNASWNGTWKLDPAKSQMTGDTVTYSMNANGTIHSSNGGTFDYNFACDGKNYTEFTGYTTACNKVGDTTYLGTDKRNGKLASTWRQVISANGKSMTVTTKGPRPDGTTYTVVDTYERLSGTSGLVGEWKHVRSTSVPGLVTIAISGNTLTMRYPSYKSSVAGRLDGSDAQAIGPTVPAGVTVSFKPLGSRQIYEVTKFKGKVIAEDTLTLSADGRMMTDVVSTPGQSAKQTYVYDKQ